MGYEVYKFQNESEWPDINGNVTLPSIVVEITDPIWSEAL